MCVLEGGGGTCVSRNHKLKRYWCSRLSVQEHTTAPPHKSPSLFTRPYTCATPFPAQHTQVETAAVAALNQAEAESSGGTGAGDQQ